MITSTQLSNQEPYLTIYADGRITVSDKLKPDETAARVLECMKTQWMEDSQSKQIRELQDRIKRLKEALDLVRPHCDSVHHSKKHQHQYGEPCPVVALIENAKEAKP